MLLNGGELNGKRVLSPRMIQYATRNFTGERGDDGMGGIAMHRGLGPHSRGISEVIRGLGSIAHPGTFGHGGVGSSYCWADPDFRCELRLYHQHQNPRPLAFAAAGADRQLCARGDRLVHRVMANSSSLRGTKQSRAAPGCILDCFASLAMTTFLDA